MTTTGGSTSAEAKSQTEQTIRRAHTILDAWGIEMSPSKMSRLARRYEAQVMPNGWTLFDFLANTVQLTAEQRRALCNPETVRFITYVDPTGETAVNNVLRRAG